MVQLGDNMLKICLFVADSCQRERSLYLGESHGRPLGPERRKAYCHYRCFHLLLAGCRFYHFGVINVGLSHLSRLLLCTGWDRVNSECVTLTAIVWLARSTLGPPLTGSVAPAVAATAFPESWVQVQWRSKQPLLTPNQSAGRDRWLDQRKQYRHMGGSYKYRIVYSNSYNKHRLFPKNVVFFHAMSQVFSHWFPSMETLVVHVEFVVDKMALRQVFSKHCARVPLTIPPVLHYLSSSAVLQ
jgi:hypothetical protein